MVNGQKETEPAVAKQLNSNTEDFPIDLTLLSDSDTDPDMPSLTDSSDENYSTDKDDSDCLDSDDANTGAPPSPSTHSTQWQQIVFKRFDLCTDVDSDTLQFGNDSQEKLHSFRVCYRLFNPFGPRNMKALTTTKFQHCVLQ